MAHEIAKFCYSVKSNSFLVGSVLTSATGMLLMTVETLLGYYYMFLQKDKEENNQQTSPLVLPYE